jgi:hypothetical protein
MRILLCVEEHEEVSCDHTETRLAEDKLEAGYGVGGLRPQRQRDFLKTMFKKVRNPYEILLRKRGWGRSPHWAL